MQITFLKKSLFAIALAITAPQALSNYIDHICDIDIKQSLNVSSQHTLITNSQNEQAQITKADGLIIDDKTVSLTDEQRELLDKYKGNLEQTVPKLHDLTQSGLELANQVIDDLAKEFNNSEAFNNVRKALADFYKKLESRYYKDGEYFFEAEAMNQFANNWEQDFADARKTFNTEFFSSALVVLQEKMTTEEGLNFTAMQEEYASLKSSISERMKKHSQQLEKDAIDYCDSLHDLAEQEKGVIESIPELKDYQLFEI